MLVVYYHPVEVIWSTWHLYIVDENKSDATVRESKLIPLSPVCTERKANIWKSVCWRLRGFEKMNFEGG